MSLRRAARRRVMRVWGVIPSARQEARVPCLAGSRLDAEDLQEPDEDIVLVRVEILRTVKHKAER